MEDSFFSTDFQSKPTEITMPNHYANNQDDSSQFSLIFHNGKHKLKLNFLYNVQISI